MKFKTLLLSALLPAACVAPRSGRHEGCEDRERGGQPTAMKAITTRGTTTHINTRAAI